MTKSTLTALTFAVVAFGAGCAAPDQDQGPASSELANAEQQLTLDECGAQRDKCFRNNPLFGLFTCPAQYTQCTTTADDGLPAQVSSAVASAAECTSTALKCTNKARGAEAIAKCAEDEAQCVAAIVGVELPDVVEGTAACVDGAIDCINGAEAVSALAGCGTDLTACAVDQVTEILPPEVGEVISDANECRTSFESCVDKAASASAITACGEKNADCVAGLLGVDLPNVGASDIVACTEDAADCALHVESLGDVADCADSLRECAADVIGSVDVPPALTCQQKWTACVTKNPFNFFGCGADLGNCTDN